MFTYTPPVHEALDIIYKDNDLLVLNKPAGLLSVPGRGEDKQDCLISRVNLEFPSALIIHRLDMSTSGIILVALNKDMQRQMSILFASNKIYKKYIAVVDGVIDIEQGEVDQALICDWPNRPKQKIDPDKGKSSFTSFRIIDKSVQDNCCRVELIPETGRTHQLRVHMQFLGHPILGDELYGSEFVADRSSRLLLHASDIKFTHPITGVNLEIDCPVPF